MPARLFLFLPVSLSILTIVVVSLSGLVSALAPPPFDAERDSRRALPLRTCADLQRRADEIARASTRCEADPGCLLSPIVCPVEMDAGGASEYARLRDLLEDRCGITPTASYRSRHPTRHEARICGVSAEAARPGPEEAAPSTFVF